MSEAVGYRAPKQLCFTLANDIVGSGNFLPWVTLTTSDILSPPEGAACVGRFRLHRHATATASANGLAISAVVHGIVGPAIFGSRWRGEPFSNVVFRTVPHAGMPQRPRPRRIGGQCHGSRAPTATASANGWAVSAMVHRIVGPAISALAGRANSLRLSCSGLVAARSNRPRAVFAQLAQERSDYPRLPSGVDGYRHPLRSGPEGAAAMGEAIARIKKNQLVTG